MQVYFDNSATTKICPSAADAVLHMLTQEYGNPSSLHDKGIDADIYLQTARSLLADALHCSPEEVYFTSGGTEANNLALLGAAAARKKKGNRIVTTAMEHPSVLSCCRHLAEQGFDVVVLSPDNTGQIPGTSILDAVTADTILVSMMLVNNEIGTRFPVEIAKEAIRRANAPALLHCDAVQAFGKIPVSPKTLGCDLLTVSAHKVHGPKGAGALFVKKGTHITPLCYGGSQEKALRPGTEPVSLLVGFGEAVKEMDVQSTSQHLERLRQYLLEQLETIPDIFIHSPKDSIPAIINFSIPGVKSETMLHFLSSRDIWVSSGSACARGEKSHVLQAIKLPVQQIDSALRVSFSHENTLEEIDYFVDCLLQGKNTLKRA